MEDGSRAGKAAWLGGVPPEGTMGYGSVLRPGCRKPSRKRNQQQTKQPKGPFRTEKVRTCQEVWFIGFLAAARLRPMRRISLPMPKALVSFHSCLLGYF